MGVNRLRDGLVDAALRICIEDGYAATSMARIAEATHTTTDEAVAVFPTPDAALLATIEDVLHAVVGILADTSPGASGVETLRTATTSVIASIADGTGAIPRRRLADVARVLVATPALRAGSRAMRVAILGPALAAHLGVEPCDRRVQHALVTWSAVVAASYNPGHHTERFLAANPVRDGRRPEVMAERLGSTFDHITRPGLA